MAINSTEMDIEKKSLLDTQQWISSEINSIEHKYDEVQKKVAMLKKSSRGTYSEELQLALMVHEITEKKLNKYVEAESQPYFARINFKESLRDEEVFYIGKFGLNDSNTEDEKVIDWRSPIADLYYSGTQGEASYEAPIGTIEGELTLKRKFLIKDGQLVEAFDEGINELIIKSGIDEDDGNSLVDEFLRINLEQSISDKLKDVVATIQKEQNDIIRANMNKPIIVQGSAGSGKTTIALHRLAYLIYRHNKVITGDDILVIAPNKLFLDYISQVLPNLGVNNVKQMTFEEICKKILRVKEKIYTKDAKLTNLLEEFDCENEKFTANSSKLKGSLNYKVLMDRYVRYLEIQDCQIQDLYVKDYVLFDIKEIKRLYMKDLVHLPLNKRKEEIQRYFKDKLKNKLPYIMDKIDNEYGKRISKVKEKMNDCTERREILIMLYDERDSLKHEIRNKSIKAVDDYFDIWILKDIKELYYNFFINEEVFSEVTSNKIPAALAQFMKHEIENNINNNVIDSDDLTAMLYLKFKIDGASESLKYKHIVVDEAQDYSLFQMEVLKNISLGNSFTIVGDIGQGIYYYKGINDWGKAVNEVFNKDAHYVPLTQSYRSTVEIIHFANKVLQKQKINLIPAKPVLRHGKHPEIIAFKDDMEFCQRLQNIVEEVESLGKKSVAVIGRTYKECEAIHKLLNKNSKIKWKLIKDTDKTIKMDKIIIPSYMTKGLEFDCSVIYNCNDKNYDESELNKKLLYVALTRALHLEYVFYNGNKSPLII